MEIQDPEHRGQEDGTEQLVCFNLVFPVPRAVKHIAASPELGANVMWGTLYPGKVVRFDLMTWIIIHA